MADIKTLRHSAAHILAHAVKNLFPKVKLGIGPTIEDGFYYDFDRKEPFTPTELNQIEQQMRKLIKQNHDFKKIKLTNKEVQDFLKKEPYKKQLYNDLKKAKAPATFYKNGEFLDLCAGPHIKKSGEVKAFKLLRSAPAYWKGDSKNKQLQRIYGTSFETDKELKSYLNLIEEAEKRDHNKIGRAMQIFTTHPDVGQGLPLLMPRGALIMKILQRFIEDEEEKRGYISTKTPYMAKSDLYKVSGHWDHYKEGMFKMEEKGEVLALRPMTCPFQFMIYKSKQRSYKELPIKYNETSTLFRNEESGEMHGLIRIRQFTLAEGHIICTPEQVEKEFKEALSFLKYVMKTLGIDKDIWFRFSKWDPKNKKKYIDNPKAWEKSQKTMKKILDSLKLKYEIADGEAAFYGPKLDIQFKNVHGKEDTIITIQIDFALPERFDLTYEGKDGRKHRPMVIHRSSIGCYERTLAMLIEKYAGKFPLWLSPTQVKIITVTDKNIPFAKKIYQQLKENNIRVELDDRAETIGKKVREAEINDKPNYIITIGDKEVKSKTLAIRDRNNKVKFKVKPQTFLKDLQKEIKTKKC